jgi:hypothetical protein
VDTIREDLGATGDVFDEITYRRLIEGAPLKELRSDLELRVEAARKRVDVPRDDKAAADAQDSTRDAEGDLKAISSELDLSPQTLHETLDSAMSIGFGRPRVGAPNGEKLCEVINPYPPTWADVLDDSVRLRTESGVLGPVPWLAFDPEAFVISLNGRPVFRPRRDALLLHLAHPLLQKGLSLLTRQRFPGGSDHEASRWTVRQAALPKGWKAMLVLTVEELAINGLRESFHHWVRTIRIPVTASGLGDPLPHEPANALHWSYTCILPDWPDTARDLWTDIEHHVRDFVKASSTRLTAALAEQVKTDRTKAEAEEVLRFQSRQGELSTLIESSTMKKLVGELAAMQAARRQGLLFDEQERLDELERNIEQREEELKRRRERYDQLRTELAKERKRIIEELIPQRYRLEGEAQVMPVTLEIVLPGGHP